ncbi:hypothetical protein CXF92_01075 [Pseudomonas sp. Choline-3u-10]|uniref:PD-(D/E)XK nuclease domain-containing protein n=1 Tax=Pseudomonadaceae TaxID=135621 RepID=UPI000C342E35|nr:MULTISPECIES: PD-(D/E)XK nuclease domain-containing protein [Pseudomonadaceae]PKG96416.1 hypothetical protein CXF92_01075 [Pseudomonas sp. Choline-3u-10]
MQSLSELGFERNLEIEKSIDRKNITLGLSAESLRSYLDVLEEFFSDYSKLGDAPAGRALADFLKYDKLSAREWLKKVLSQEELYYLENFEATRSKIRETLSGRSYRRWDFIHYMLGLVEESCCHQSTREAIKSSVVMALESFRGTVFQVIETQEALTIYLPGHRHVIYVADEVGDYKQKFSDCLVSVVFNYCNCAPLHKDIARQVNIYSISVKNERGRFERVYTSDPLDWCVSKLDKLNYLLNKSREKSTYKDRLLAELSECRNDLELLRRDKSAYAYYQEDRLSLDAVKKARSKILNCAAHTQKLSLSAVTPEFSTQLYSIERILKLAFKSMVQRLELHRDIMFSLGEIKRNNTLYVASGVRGKKIEYAFGEENLSAMLASNLKCMHSRANNISIYCEALVGNGRSDIKIIQGSTAVAVIECKLARAGANVSDKVVDAIDQLYARYSENEYANAGADIQLYFVLFSHDKDFRAIAQTVSETLKGYARRNNLIYDLLERSENGVRFSYTEDRGDNFAIKRRVINLVVCNLEVEFHARAKMRKNLKNYSPFGN